MLSAKQKTFKKSTLAVGAVIFFMMMAALPMAYADETDPWVDIPENEIVDWGEMWGTVIQFQYVYDPEAGNQAQAITWDFGDGSERSNEWNPRHTYTQKGTYIVVQHVTNSYEGFSEDWGYYRFSIMGKPYAEIVMPEDAEPMAKIYATKGTAPAMPENDPVFEGHTFRGYYADEEYTVPFDWTVPIDTPVTVYAHFTSDSPTTIVPDDETPEPTEVSVNLASVAIYGLTGLILIGAVYTRHPILILISAGLIAVISLNAFDVIDLSGITGVLK